MKIMNKKQIIDKIIDDLPTRDMRYEMSADEWYGWFEEAFDKMVEIGCKSGSNNCLKEEIKSLVQKWDDRVEIHRSVCSEHLMFTKEERLENSHYAQAICAVIADVKKLTNKT